VPEVDDFHAHPRDVSDEQLDEIVEYEQECLRKGMEGLRLNGHLVLAMIREIRRRRRAEGLPTTSYPGRRTSWDHVTGPNPYEQEPVAPCEPDEHKWDDFGDGGLYICTRCKVIGDMCLKCETICLGDDCPKCGGPKS